jgi:hypothetical protein
MGTTDYSRPEPEVEAEVQALLENWIVTGQQRLVEEARLLAGPAEWFEARLAVAKVARRKQEMKVMPSAVQVHSMPVPGAAGKAAEVSLSPSGAEVGASDVVVPPPSEKKSSWRRRESRAEPVVGPASVVGLAEALGAKANAKKISPEIQPGDDIGGSSKQQQALAPQQTMEVGEPAKIDLEGSVSLIGEAATAAMKAVVEGAGREVLKQAALIDGEPLKPERALVAGTDRARQRFQREPSTIPSTYINARIGVWNCGLHCRYDTFHNRLIVEEFECSDAGDAEENLDNIALKVRDLVIAKFGFDPGKNHVYDAILSMALENTFDPVRDYLDRLVWDRRPRLDRWVVEHMGAEETALNCAVGRKMLIAGVRRVRLPGCKFDYIPVFEGAQGSGRSTSLKVLAGGEENFSDAEVIMLSPKDKQEQIQGVWIYELAELAGYAKADVNRFKNFVSQTVDRARPAFGRSRIDRPRRCIFVGTTNDDEYLKDQTGNRRHWPVKLKESWRIDLERLQSERDQLWAEAAAAEAAVDAMGRKEPLFIPEELWPEAAVEQAKRMVGDPWEGLLQALIVDGRPGGIYANFIDGTQADLQGNPEWRISTADLLAEVLDIPPARQYPSHSNRLAGVMRKLGWQKPSSSFRIKKKVCNGYRRPKGL